MVKSFLTYVIPKNPSEALHNILNYAKTVGSPIFDCPQLLVQYIRSYFTYLVAISNIRKTS
jgi:hypothetical protein